MTHFSARHKVVSLVLVLMCLSVATTSLPSCTTVQAADSSVMRRDEEVQFWELEVQKLRAKAMRPALERVELASAALANAKRNRSTPAATIRALDEDYQESIRALARVREQEEAMVAKLKPLYGVLSLQFAQEQKDQMASSISFVKDSSFQNAMFDSIFNIGSAESFTDVISDFFLQWVVCFILMYPFAVLYYALWSLPWSIYAYSSGFTSLFPAFFAYASSVIVFSLPLVILCVGFFMVAKQQATQRRRRQHYD